MEPGPGEFDELIQRYLDDSLTAEERVRLGELVKTNPELARRLAFASKLEVLTSHLLKSKPLAAAPPERSAEKRGAPDSIRKPPTRRWVRRRFSRQGPTTWVPALAAAGVLFVVVVLFTLRSTAPPKPTGGPEGSVGREAGKDPRPREDAGQDQARRKAQEDRARAEQLRMEAEARLASLRREGDRLSDERKKAQESQEEDLRKKADEAFSEIVRKMKSEEERVAKLREAEEAARRALAKTTPEPTPRQEHLTRAAVARVERLEGEVYRITSAGKTPAKVGEDLLSGQGIETAGEKSLAIVRFSDQTRVETVGTAEVKEIKAERGKHLFMVRGEIRADVARQPQGQPMVIATPHGEATVLGTTLRIIVDPDPKKGMRLEVEEGKVQLKNLAGKAVMVESGHYAVAATGVELAAKRLPIDEILLLPKQGRLVGGGWKKMKDDRASSGEALEILKIPDLPKIEDFLAYAKAVHVTFTFDVDAEKDYYVWIRGACASPERLRSQDALHLDLPGGLINAASYAEFGLNSGYFQGYSGREGYWWIGGDADLNPPNPRPDDVRPTTVRFTQPGRKAARLFASEVPMRVDAIWLSATQKTRPADTQQGPAGRRN